MLRESTGGSKAGAAVTSSKAVRVLHHVSGWAGVGPGSTVTSEVGRGFRGTGRWAGSRCARRRGCRRPPRPALSPAPPWASASCQGPRLPSQRAARPLFAWGGGRHEPGAFHSILLHLMSLIKNIVVLISRIWFIFIIAICHMESTTHYYILATVFYAFFRIDF